MASWLRRIRGVLGMGFAWAVAWGFVGGIPRWVFGLRADAPFGIIFGILGFIAGVAFSLVLLLTERRRSFDQMSMKRFAGWGAIGGLALAGIFTRMASLQVGDVLLITPTFVLACAACATGSLALARRAERRELPDYGTPDPGTGKHASLPTIADHPQVADSQRVRSEPPRE